MAQSRCKVQKYTRTELKILHQVDEGNTEFRVFDIVTTQLGARHFLVPLVIGLGGAESSHDCRLAIKDRTQLEHVLDTLVKLG